MKAVIEINVESILDLNIAIGQLRSMIRAEINRRQLKPHADVFPEGMVLYDDNCYGNVSLTVVSAEY